MNKKKKEGELSNLDKIRILRNRQTTRKRIINKKKKYPHAEEYIKHYDNDDLDSYYKTHKASEKKVYPEEII